MRGHTGYDAFACFNCKQYICPLILVRLAIKPTFRAVLVTNNVTVICSNVNAIPYHKALAGFKGNIAACITTGAKPIVGPGEHANGRAGTCH